MDDRREPTSEKVPKPSHLGQPTTQQTEEIDIMPASEVGHPGLEERFANWGTD